MLRNCQNAHSDHDDVAVAEFAGVVKGVVVTAFFGGNFWAKILPSPRGSSLQLSELILRTEILYYNIIRDAHGTARVICVAVLNWYSIAKKRPAQNSESLLITPPGKVYYSFIFGTGFLY